MRALLNPVGRIAIEAWVLLLALGLLSFTAFEMGQTCWLVFYGLLAVLVIAYGSGSIRSSTGKPSGILAPVDGRVVFRRECHDPYLQREAIRIGIAVAPFANYFLRAPVEAEVVDLPAAGHKVSRLQTDEGDEIVIVVRRGWMLGAKPVMQPIGERVGQGKRCGLRRGALYIDVYVPAHARVEVNLQQAVKSGETVLATILRKH